MKLRNVARLVLVLCCAMLATALPGFKMRHRRAPGLELDSAPGLERSGQENAALRLRALALSDELQQLRASHPMIVQADPSEEEAQGPSELETLQTFKDCVDAALKKPLKKKNKMWRFRSSLLKCFCAPGAQWDSRLQQCSEWL